jgi:hypothetical protein
MILFGGPITIVDSCLKLRLSRILVSKPQPETRERLEPCVLLFVPTPVDVDIDRHEAVAGETTPRCIPRTSTRSREIRLLRGIKLCMEYMV